MPEEEHDSRAVDPSVSLHDVKNAMCSDGGPADTHAGEGSWPRHAGRDRLTVPVGFFDSLSELTAPDRRPGALNFRSIGHHIESRHMQNDSLTAGRDAVSRPADPIQNITGGGDDSAQPGRATSSNATEDRIPSDRSTPMRLDGVRHAGELLARGPSSDTPLGPPHADRLAFTDTIADVAASSGSGPGVGATANLSLVDESRLIASPDILAFLPRLENTSNRGDLAVEVSRRGASENLAVPGSRRTEDILGSEFKTGRIGAMTGFGMEALREVAGLLTRHPGSDGTTDISAGQIHESTVPPRGREVLATSAGGDNDLQRVQQLLQRVLDELRPEPPGFLPVFSHAAREHR